MVETALQPDQVRFVNEGVASIVFACVRGELNGRVLRFPKRPYQDTERDDIARQRITSIFAALFSPEYVLAERLVLVPCSVLRAMLTDAGPHRADWRRAQFDLVDVPEAGYWPAWLMDDMTRIGRRALFTVELKPKWGFLLRPEQYGADPIQTRICRNCIYQCYKQAQGRVPQISRYCPLDLFHGDEQRRRRALDHLLQTPQNNLVVFGDDRPPDPDLVDLVAAVLADHRALLARVQGAQQITALTLPRVQQLLLALTPNEWAALQSDPLSSDTVDRLTRQPPLFEDLVDYPECVRDAAAFVAADEVVPDAIAAPSDVADPLAALRILLLEMTARDVSLMMTFVTADEPIQSDADGTERTPPIRRIRCWGRDWLYKIAVVDLETKYPAKIQHWIDVERDMLAHFRDLCAKAHA